MISSSGDGTCILWDVEKQAATRIFMDHTGDVMSVDLNSKNRHLFCSGSVDQSAIPRNVMWEGITRRTSMR